MTHRMPFDFTVNKADHSVRVTRTFAAPVDLVWAAWTTPELLDLWWAPRPWQAITKSMDFREGGYWLYAMTGPNGEKQWCRADYEAIAPGKSYTATDTFCDETGHTETRFPNAHWDIRFEGRGDTTIVHVHIAYEDLAQLEKIIEMGFREGFTMALGNLDQYIKAQFKLRAAMRSDTRPRVSTYVNFPGQTEEAFNFYRGVFGTEFTEPGIRRFGELPPDPQSPPVSESVKSMVLHVELPLPGGHVLMGTDAPKEMGFTVTRGNNMHIQLEPDNRAEADRLFQALSAGGEVAMPLQDMFWGAYFGSFTDRFGINWMINCHGEPGQDRPLT